MPSRLAFGHKVSFCSEDSRPGVHLRASNNLLFPLGLPPSQESELQFENAVFQVLSGYGDVSPDLTSRRFGEEITFGQMVRLLHVASNSLVCIHPHARATHEMAHHKITLEKFTSDEAKNSRFRILPKYKTRSEGQKICETNVVVLQSAAGDVHLHIASNNNTNNKNNKNNNNNSNNDQSHWLECNAAPTQSGFYLMLYDTDTNVVDALDFQVRCGDCLQFFHKERSALLSSEVVDPMPYLEVTEGGGRNLDDDLFGATGGGGGDSKSTSGGNKNDFSASSFDANSGNDQQSHYQVDPDAVGASEGLVGHAKVFPSTSLFVVEQEDIFTGGPVLLGKRKMYRLKNLSTGLFLAARLKNKEASSSSSLSSPAAVSSNAAVNPRDCEPHPGMFASANSLLFPVANKDFEVCMIADPNDPGVFICFHQAGDDNTTTARHHSRVYFEFPLVGATSQEEQEERESGLWLSSVDEEDNNNNNNNTLNNFSSLQQSFAASNSSMTAFGPAAKERIRLSTTNGISRKDGVEIRKVPYQEFQELNSVVVLMPPLQNLLSELSDISSFTNDQNQKEEQEKLRQKKSNPLFLHLLQHVRDNVSTMITMITPESTERNPLVREGAVDSGAQQRFIDQRVVFTMMDVIEKLAVVANMAPSSKKGTGVVGSASPPEKEQLQQIVASMGQNPNQEQQQQQDGKNNKAGESPVQQQESGEFAPVREQQQASRPENDDDSSPLLPNQVPAGLFANKLQQQQQQQPDSPQADKSYRVRAEVVLAQQVDAIIYHIIQLGFRLIRMCAFSNESVSIQMKDLVPRMLVFASHPKKKIGATDALVEMFRDHMSLVDNPDDVSTINAVLALVKAQLRSGCSSVNLLRALTYCESHGIRTTQNVVGQQLLVPALENLPRAKRDAEKIDQKYVEATIRESKRSSDEQKEQEARSMNEPVSVTSPSGSKKKNTSTTNNNNNNSNANQIKIEAVSSSSSDKPIFFYLWCVNGEAYIDVSTDDVPAFQSSSANVFNNNNDSDDDFDEKKKNKKNNNNNNSNNNNQRQQHLTLEEFFEFYTDFAARGSSNSVNTDASSRASNMTSDDTFFAKKLLSAEITPPASLLHQLRLVASLCADRHEDNINMVRILYPWQLVESISKNLSLPGEIRAAAFNIIQHAYVDVPPLPDLIASAENPVFLWEDVVARNKGKPHNGYLAYLDSDDEDNGDENSSEEKKKKKKRKKNPKDIEFEAEENEPRLMSSREHAALTRYKNSVEGIGVDKLVPYVKEYIRGSGSMQITNRDENVCMEAVLMLVKSFIRFGWIDSSEYSEWLNAITPVLDGRNDSGPPDWDRFRYDERNHIVMSVKILCVDCISMIATIIRTGLVQVMVSNFELGKCPAHLCMILDLRPKSLIHAKSLELERARIARDQSASNNELVNSLLSIGSGAAGFLSGMADVLKFSDDPMENFSYLQELFDVLLDSSCYQFDKLIRRSMCLFLELTNLHWAIRPALRQLQLLSTASNEAFYNQMRKLHLKMRVYKTTQISTQDLGHVRKVLREVYRHLQDTVQHEKDGLFVAAEERFNILRHMGFHEVVATILAKTAALVPPAFGGYATVETGSGGGLVGVGGALEQCINLGCQFLNEFLGHEKLAAKIAADLAPFVRHFTSFLAIMPDHFGSILKKIFSCHFDVCRNVSAESVENLLLAVATFPTKPELAHLVRLLVFQTTAMEQGDGLIARNQRMQTRLITAFQHAPTIEILLHPRDFFTHRKGIANITNLLNSHDYLNDESEMITRLELLLTVVNCARGRSTEQRVAARHIIFGSSVLSSIEAITPMLDKNPAVGFVFSSLLMHLFVDDPMVLGLLCDSKHVLEKILQKFSTVLSMFSNAITSPSSPLNVQNDSTPRNQQQQNNNNNEDDNSQTIQSRKAMVESFEVQCYHTCLSVIPCISTLLEAVVLDREDREGTTFGLCLSLIEIATGILDTVLQRYPITKRQLTAEDKNKLVLQRTKAMELIGTSKGAHASAAASITKRRKKNNRRGKEEEENDGQGQQDTIIADVDQELVTMEDEQNNNNNNNNTNNNQNVNNNNNNNNNNNTAGKSNNPLVKSPTNQQQQQQEQEIEEIGDDLNSPIAVVTTGPTTAEDLLKEIPDYILVVGNVVADDIRMPSSFYFEETPHIGICPAITCAEQMPLICLRHLADLLEMGLKARMVTDSSDVEAKISTVRSIRLESDLNEALGESRKNHAFDKSTNNNNTNNDDDQSAEEMRMSPSAMLLGASQNNNNNNNNNNGAGSPFAIRKPTFSLQDRWHQFVAKFERTATGLQEATMFRTPARLSLRRGLLGHKMIKSVVRSLESPHVTSHDRSMFLAFLRQVLVVTDEDFSDAAIILPTIVDDDFKDEDEAVAWQKKKKLLTIEKTLDERQNIMAAWKEGALLPPKLVRLVNTSNPEMTQAALLCGIAILEGGNNTVQKTLMEYFLSTNRETFFAVCRTYLSRARDAVQERTELIQDEMIDRHLERATIEVIQEVGAQFDFTTVTLLLKFIQQFTEGHYTDAQNYLREQEDNQVSINVLDPLMSLLETLVLTGIDFGIFDLTMQVLATLVESIQGPCLGNTKYIISQGAGRLITKIVGNLHSYLSDEDTFRLSRAAMSLLLALLEGHSNPQMVSMLLQSITMKVLVDRMDATYDEWSEEYVSGFSKLTSSSVAQSNFVFRAISQVSTEVYDAIHGLIFPAEPHDEYNDRLNLSCSIFIFMKSILDLEYLLISNAMLDTTDELNFQFKDREDKTMVRCFRESTSFKEMSRIVATIEILRNGKVERCYFRIPESCRRNLQEDSKKKIIDHVDRGGDGARLTSFFEMSFNLINELDLYEKMRQTRGLSLVNKYAPLADNLGLLCSFVQNFILLGCAEFVYEDDSPAHLPEGPAQTAYTVFGIILMAIQSLLLVNFWIGELQIYLNEAWQVWQEDLNREEIQESKRTLSIIPPKIEDDSKEKLTSIERFGLNVYFTFTYPPLYKYGLFFALSYLAFFLVPLLYCIQPLQIIWKSPTLYNVVEAITSNKTSLILTAILLLVFMNIFTFLAYFIFSDMFNADSFGEGGNCDSLARCFATVLNYGLRSGGGIGDVATIPIYTSGPDRYFARYFYDMFFYVVMIILFLNILFGIIVDSFGALREARDAVDVDQESKCFTCGLSRDDLDKVTAGGFEQHIKYEHSMWNYVFFMMYLRGVDENEHTGQEGFVWQCMQNHDPRWFPIGRALAVDYAPANATASISETAGEGENEEENGEEEEEGSSGSAKSQKKNSKGKEGGGGEGEKENESATTSRPVSRQEKKNNNNNTNTTNNNDNQGGNNNNDASSKLLLQKLTKMEEKNKSLENQLTRMENMLQQLFQQQKQ